MNHASMRSLAALLAACATAAFAAPNTPTQADRAASGPSASLKKPGTAPAAGGNGGGVSSNGSNTAGQVTPKKPKCPDPLNTACPANKAIGK